MDIFELGKLAINGGGSAAFIGILLILAIPNLRKKVFGNGNGYVNVKDVIEEVMATVDSNHLHQMPELLLSLKEIKETLERMERKQDEGREKVVEKLSYISAKINGKS